MSFLTELSLILNVYIYRYFMANGIIFKVPNRTAEAVSGYWKLVTGLLGYISYLLSANYMPNVAILYSKVILMNYLELSTWANII